jgi:hypothetical protein
MSFWTDANEAANDVGMRGSLENALIEYAGMADLPPSILARNVEMIKAAAPNLPADFDYTQAVQNMVAKQNAQFGGFSQKDLVDGQLAAKLFEQIPGGAEAMQNLQQLPSFQSAQAFGTSLQEESDNAGDSFLGGIARPFLDTGSAINDMRKEGVLNPILAAVGAAYMPQISSALGGSGGGAGMGGLTASADDAFLGNYFNSIGAGAPAAAGATGGVNSMADLFGSGTSTAGTGLGFNPSSSSGLGFKLGSGAATAGLGAGSASPGIIQQLANFTGLSASSIQSLGGAAISSLASLVGAGMTADAAKKAAQGIADANASSNQLMAQINAQNQARQEPFYQAGLKALPAYSQGVMPGGNLVRPFSNADFQADPGYGFRLSEGMKALDRSAASRGNLLSGATLKGAERYGQGLASQEYQNAYNRYTGDQATQRNALASLTGFAPTASSAMQAGDMAYGSNAANLASNTANAMAGAGATRSSSYGNALAGIGQNVYNAMNPNPMNSIMAAYMQNQMTPRTGGF